MTTETSNARGVLVPRDVVDFLMGEGELQGAWFGETPTGERGQWFWRKHLRHAKDATPPPAAARGDVRGLVDVVSDLRHSAVVDDYEIDQIAFLNSIADRIESALAAEGVQCETCNDRGEVGGPAGQTAESFGYETFPCPDCAEGVQAGEVASWQRSIELRPGHWGEWAEYTDIYGEGRPEKVGRFNCRYRPLYAASDLSQQPEARGVVDGEVKFNAAFFVSRTGHRIEQLTTYSDYRRDGALLALMDLGQKRASAKGLTKKNAGKVVLAWVTAPQIVECDHALTGERNG